MHCEPIRDASGEVVAIARVSDDLTDEGRAALTALVEAVRRDMDADPSIGARQEAAIARVRERVRLRGEADE